MKKFLCDLVVEIAQHRRFAMTLKGIFRIMLWYLSRLTSLPVEMSIPFCNIQVLFVSIVEINDDFRTHVMTV